MLDKAFKTNGTIYAPLFWAMICYMSIRAGSCCVSVNTAYFAYLLDWVVLVLIQSRLLLKNPPDQLFENCFRDYFFLVNF